jgi:hypothetical protein
MAKTTRDPSKVSKTIAKGGLIGIIVTWIISQFFPGTDPMTQGAITTCAIVVGGAVGKECRNYVYSFEEGGDREGLEKNGLGVSVFRVLGDLFI